MTLIANTHKTLLKTSAVILMASSLSGCLISANGETDIGNNVTIGTGLTHDLGTGHTSTGLGLGVSVFN